MSNLPFFCQHSSKSHGATPATGPRNQLSVSDRRGAVRMFRREFPALSRVQQTAAFASKLRFVAEWKRDIKQALANLHSSAAVNISEPDTYKRLSDITVQMD
ncbi:hypothetical protein ACI3LZ_002073 [Candidozyma auris]